MTRRRDLLLGTLGLAGLALGWQAFTRRPRQFDFAVIPGLTGWSIAETASVSIPSGSAFATIGQDNEATGPLPSDRLERVLYREQGRKAIAVFTDFFCPYCRTLTKRLSERPDIPVVWHELPLLGPASVIAARAAVAADMQGQYPAFFTALSDRGFRPTPAHMATVAAEAGLDGVKFARDMAGPAVDRRILDTRRAADTLGIYGTPAIASGRRVILGEITMAELDRFASRA